MSKFTIDELKSANKNLEVVGGSTWDEITTGYVDKFKAGYTLTVEEIQWYFCCSYDFVIRFLKGEYKHININAAGKKILINSYEKGNLDEIFFPLLIKRLLYSRNDFKQSLKETIILKVDYKKMDYLSLSYTKDFNDFLAFIKRFFLENSIKENPKLYIQKLMQASSIALYGVSEKTFDIHLSPEIELPHRLYSMKELKKELDLRHDIQVYRILKKKGIDKWEYNGLIRYNIDDFKKEYLIINYEKYLFLKDTGYTDETFLREIMNTAKKILLGEISVELD